MHNTCMGVQSVCMLSACVPIWWMQVFEVQVCIYSLVFVIYLMCWCVSLKNLIFINLSKTIHLFLFHFLAFAWNLCWFLHKKFTRTHICLVLTGIRNVRVCLSAAKKRWWKNSNHFCFYKKILFQTDAKSNLC